MSATSFIGVFLFLAVGASLIDQIEYLVVLETFIIFVLIALCFFICGILFFAAGLHDPDRNESTIKQPRFYTVDKDGKTVLADVDTILAKPSIDCKEIRRADGKVDVSMEVHNKEQAVEVLAVLAVMYDKGDIAAGEYHSNVHKIREHFNL